MTDDRARAAYIRRLVLSRCGELSVDEIAAAFADEAQDTNASVLAEIADVVSGAIKALEERLTELERGLPVH